ncbi:hypothetical protein [Cohnella phaseoli]|uniref:Uncharacterized protein n=1 Tax=Cohnella phaseoli TaxID=456490 RepID=A0A3D9KIK7_9BACL|nr:hypothetical protein [Cohnella phaseoli]RED86338.1 hypothetical protein DFP98_103193 [Cohnella phaseoli]
MDVKMINNAFLNGLTVEVWRAGELIGSGRIVEHTKDFIMLDDGDFYSKDWCELVIC